MIKTYTMFNKTEKYTIENDKKEEIFVIPKKTLSIAGKKLYDAIFSKFERGDELKLNKDKSFDDANDKLSTAVYNNVNEILNKIANGINEVEEKIGEVNE